MRDFDGILKAAAELLEHRTPVLDRGELSAFVGGFLDRREIFLQTCLRHGSPLYVIDKEALLERARQFTGAFGRMLPRFGVYYALKSNNHPEIARTLVAAGLGLDVSSGLELQIALDCEAGDIVFSGPGKTEDELIMAVENRDRTTVLTDSFGELERLERVAAAKGTHIRAGVRLTTDESGLWRKFGIPLADLARFLDAAKQCDHVRVCGLQFHTSWNLAPDNQVNFIGCLGDVLGTMQPEKRAMIEFIDIGGGFWPARGEWLQAAGTPEGRLSQAIVPASKPSLEHYKCPSTPIEDFAGRIAQAVKSRLFPHVSCRICAEPGRWLCNDAMHIVLTVVDKKAQDLVVTDAGANAVGWERFESDYFPVINLTRPDLEEHECLILGALCTPHDVWGYGYFGKEIHIGDVLLIPTQGAYTYSLRQQFIKPLPKVAILEKGG
jgi:diaminopimelate decarboxylase